MTEKETFSPYIHHTKKIKEFSLRATILGMVFGFLFAIGNAYLGLKTGATVSASIPAAILSVAILKMFFKNSTILENNIVQTIATVGEGMAAGVVFTIPALIFLGETPSIYRIFLLSLLGGILGILFMIPMRRFLIVDEHKTLPYPEGTACADILKASDEKGSSALSALWGFIAAAFYKMLANIFFIWQEVPVITLKYFKNTVISMDTTPALLGVGYIIGPRISAIMLSGGAIAWWAIIPLIKIFAAKNTLIFPSHIPINLMNAEEIWSNYVRYIGAGAVAIGGILNLAKIMPIIYKTFILGIKELFGRAKHRKNLDRTDKDISMAWLILGAIAIILTLWLLPFDMNIVTIILLVILSLFFVAVTSITVGLVGSSSNPTSGMTITTLLITCLIFVAIGWTERIYLISAITMGCVANVAIAMAGTTSQDLKTGYLLGATPRSQQLSEIIGVIIPAIALGISIYLLNEAYTLGSAKMPAPQASLMAMIAKGIIAKELPFHLVTIGVVLGIVAALLGVAILPFAIGIYLPLSLTTATMVGGIISFIVQKSSKDKSQKQVKGALIASGMIGGDALFGVIIAFLAISQIIPTNNKSYLPSWTSFIFYSLLALFLLFFTLKKSKK